VGELIGLGAFGSVTIATHVAGGPARALKILRSELVADAPSVERFEREAEALRSFELPGVAKVHDRGRHADGRPFFVMDLLHGNDLEAELRRRGRLPLAEALPILSSICDTLAAAHSHRIVHRDIKPSNIFLTRGAGGTEVRVLDFGLAKLLDDPGPNLTASRQLLGTPVSMAPEQIVGGCVDARTDVYALGVLTFQMLAGVPPFVDTSVLGLCQLHLYAGVPNLSARVNVVPALDAVITRAMSKEPGHRHRSVKEFWEAVLAAIPDTGAVVVRRAARLMCVAVEVRVDPAVLENPEGPLLDELERIVPRAAEFLEAAGVRRLLVTGNTLLAGVELASDEAVACAERRRAATVALALRRELVALSPEHTRVALSISLALGDVEFTGDRVSSGAVFDEVFALAGVSAEHVLATPEVLAGTDLPSASLPGNAGFMRLIDQL
jgi:serine/threonine-protein kinase